MTSSKNDDVVKLERELNCKCKTPTHNIKVMSEVNDVAGPSLVIYYTLESNCSFIDRLIIAFRYIFNLKQTKFQHYDTILTEKSVVRLHNLCERHLVRIETFNQKQKAKGSN